MEKILQALSFATQKHLNQKRRDKITPLIEHPMSVALLVSTYTQDEDVIIAALLHDTIEDAHVTFSEITDKFGSRVANIVKDCTEEDRSLPWADRKQAVLDKIPNISKEAVLVKSADIVHNLSELLQKVEDEGPHHFNSFNADIKTKLDYEEKRLQKIKLKFPDSPFNGKIESILGKLKVLAEDSK